MLGSVEFAVNPILGIINTNNKTEVIDEKEALNEKIFTIRLSTLLLLNKKQKPIIIKNIGNNIFKFRTSFLNVFILKFLIFN